MRRFLLFVAGTLSCAKPPPPAGTPGPRVTSDPAGLEIVVDGAPIGLSTPAQIPNWESGWPHTLALMAPGRVPFRVTIPAGPPPPAVDAVLAPAALAEVTSEPPGATVTAPGLLSDATPAKLSLPAGAPVELSFTLDGYLPEERSVTALAGQTVRAAVAFRKAATVDLQSDPEGAELSLDGVAVGRAPLQLPVAAAAAHRVKMSMAGLLPCERAFKLDWRAVKTLSCDLDDAQARELRRKIAATQLSLEVAQRQLHALSGDRPSVLRAALAAERRRNQLEARVQQLSDEEEREQGDLEAHRTELEERFEKRE